MTNEAIIMNEKLNPCRLCGKRPVLTLNTEEKYITIVVKCDCGQKITMDANATFVSERLLKEAIWQWNHSNRVSEEEVNNRE